MEEHRWSREIRKGNKQYFSDIAEKYYDDIYRFCTFETGSREDAYDLTQETFLRFIRYAENCHTGNLKGYLLTIAMNLCRDYHRRKNREALVCWRGVEIQELCETTDFKEATGQEGAFGGGRSRMPEERTLERETGELLLAAVRELPDIQREAVLLHYLYGMKYREIGRLTGVGTSTVKSRVRQGIDKLRGLLREEDFYET